MRWDKSNSEPVAFTSGDREWGLIESAEDTWALHLIRAGREIKVVKIFFGSNDVPFDLANKEIEKYKMLRRSAKWEERDIGKTEPGREGLKGGCLIR